MKYAVKAAEMKAYDEYTINKIGIPSIVLMERAALCVVFHLSEKLGDTAKKVLVAAGAGNNGGDGLAVGRILALKGHKVDFFMAGNQDKCSLATSCRPGYSYALPWLYMQVKTCNKLLLWHI